MENKKEIDSILDSLGGLQKASPGAFFFTRVRARLENEETGFWGRLAGFITRPAVAFATLGLIFLLNAAALVYHKESAAGADQTEQSITDDYNTTVASNSYYVDNTEAH